jgi:hypothetical protein
MVESQMLYCDIGWCHLFIANEIKGRTNTEK